MSQTVTEATDWLKTLANAAARRARVSPEQGVTVLGLNAYHADSAACLIVDGSVVAAAEEERFRRVKHWAGFPSEAIAYCLHAGGVRLRDIHHVAINSNPSANRAEKLRHLLRRRPDPAWVVQRLRNAWRRGSITQELARHFPDDPFSGEIHRVEHHLSHLASAFLVSPFEKSVVVSVDASGDFATASWGFGDGTQLAIDGRVMFPHSLGCFYEAITQHLGFWNYGDEYKVMGLAPYGKPTLMNQMRRLVMLEPDGTYRLALKYFVHHETAVSEQWNNESPVVGRLFSHELEDLLGPARQKGEPLTDHHRDIAHSAQAMYEEAFFHLLNVLHRRYGSDNLSLAGGCAMNSVANGKVRLRTPFKAVYVQSAAGDAGGAIGAALAVNAARASRPTRHPMEHAYWGPEFSDEQIVSTLLAAGEDLATFERRRVTDIDELCDRVARAIADGNVVGWFQGRMEWGPRALGNRSILADPRRPDMKDILNMKIKRRESFRPFAPSILNELVGEWFEQVEDVPFMMQVFQVRQEKRARIPAVTHVDGSGRLQTVRRETNPRYHRLIETFYKLTDVPMVLNTSFNENEPVVCRPKEALDCFVRTKMDMLVIGDHVLTRLPEGLKA